MFNFNHMFGFEINRELSLNYLSTSIRALVISMIGIFIPIFILTLGYDVRDVILYHIFFYVLITSLISLATKIISKVGLKFSIATSFPLLIISYLLLYSSEVYKISIYWSLIPSVMSFLAFWPAFQIYFAKSSDHSHRGREIGFLSSINLILSAIGPTLAALIITFFGFGILFISVSIIMLLAIIPIYGSEEKYPKSRFYFKDLYNKRRKIKEPIIFFSEGINIICELLFWPLLIYFLFNDLLIVGYLGSVLYISILISLYLASKYSDSRKKHKLMIIGSILYAGSWIVRTAVKSLQSVLGASIGTGITSTLLDVPYSSIFYDKLSKKTTTEYVVFREIFVGFGRIFILLIFYFTNSFIIVFGLAALASFIRGFYR